MKVRFSSDARSYLAHEVGYLKKRSSSGAARFMNVVDRARRLVSQHNEVGFADSKVPIKGARRISVGDYLFDYDIIDGVVWIQNIVPSQKTPILSIDDEEDYDAPFNDEPRGP